MRKGSILPIAPSSRSGQARNIKHMGFNNISERRGSILPIAVMAFAIVAFLFLVMYAVTPGLKYPWSMNTTTTKSVVNTSANVNTIANTNTAVEPTADWKTYTNTQYNFSLKYPADGIILYDVSRVRIQNYPENAEISKLSSGQFYVEIFMAPDLLHSTTLCKNSVSDGVMKSFGAVSGLFGAGVNGGDSGGARTAAACFQTQLFTGTFQVTEHDGGTLGQLILKTLTFTSAPSDWKTYTNSAAGYTIQYPATWKVTTSTIDNEVVSMSPPDADKKTSIELGPNLVVAPAVKIDSSDCVTESIPARQKEIRLGNLSAIRTTSGCLYDLVSTYFAQPSPKTGFMRVGWPEVFEKDYPEYEQIASTFTFSSIAIDDTRVIFSDVKTQAPIIRTNVSLYSDNGVRCVTEPCPTNGRSWTGITDAEGAVLVPASMVDESMTFTLDGYNAKELHSGTLQADQSWKLSLTKK